MKHHLTVTLKDLTTLHSALHPARIAATQTIKPLTFQGQVCSGEMAHVENVQPGGISPRVKSRFPKEEHQLHN